MLMLTLLKRVISVAPLTMFLNYGSIDFDVISNIEGVLLK